MMNELITLQPPQVPDNWNYDESVKKTKQILYRWKNLTAELANELWVAREKLRAQGRRTHVET